MMLLIKSQSKPIKPTLPACGTSTHGMNANAWAHVVLHETATRERQTDRQGERERECYSHQSRFQCFVAPDLSHLIATHRGAY